MKIYETRTHAGYRIWHWSEAESPEKAAEWHFRCHTDAADDLDGAACVEVREKYGDGTITRYHVERTVRVARHPVQPGDVIPAGEGWDGNGSPL